MSISSGALPAYAAVLEGLLGCLNQHEVLIQALIVIFLAMSAGDIMHVSKETVLGPPFADLPGGHLAEGPAYVALLRGNLSMTM